MLKSKKIKKLIGWAIFALFVGVTLFLLIKIATPEPNRYGTDYADIDYNGFGTDITERITAADTDTVVLENDYLQLSVTQDTTLKLLQKSTGKVYTTALDAERSAMFVEDSADMASAVTCEYQRDNINTSVMYSSNEAIDRTQYRISVSEDGSELQLEYILGEKADDSPVPLAIRKDFFEKKILAKLSEEDREYMSRRYTLYKYSELTVYDDPEAMLKQYPGLKENDLYISVDLSNDRIRTKTAQLLQSVGYTSDDLADDNIASGIQYDEEIPIFHVAMRYRLEGSQLVMTVPAEELKYTESYPLRSLIINKFFISSAGADGKFLVPSGSGALMSFNGNTEQSVYQMPFYGNDSTRKISVSSEEMFTNTSLTLPCFGMISGGSGVLAVVEQGAEQADLCIKRNGQSAFAYVKLNVLQSTYVSLGTAQNPVSLACDDISEDLTVRYCFMDNLSEEGYTEMAAEYRKLLVGNGALSEANEKTAPAVMLDLVGGAELDYEVLKLYTTNKMTAFTTFEQMLAISKDFKSAGIENLGVKISGWAPRGLYSQIPGETKVASSLGGKKGLDSLISSLDSLNIGSYLEVAHQYYYNSTFGDSYNSDMTAIFANKADAVLTQYDAVSGFYLRNSLKTEIISPEFFTEIAKNYINTDYSGFAIGRLASDVNSDYSEKHFYDRGRSRAQVEKTLEMYADAEKALIAQDANAYAFKYLSVIENVPTDAGGNIQFEKSVPFKQLVLHGAVSYTTALSTDTADFTADVLKAIETGSGLSITLANAIPRDIFGSDYSYLYSAEYQTMGDRAIAAAQSVNKALYGLENVAITGHSSNGSVSKTTYQNGTVIYVNHGDTDAVAEGITVPAKSYIRN